MATDEDVVDEFQKQKIGIRVMHEKMWNLKNQLLCNHKNNTRQKQF